MKLIYEKRRLKKPIITAIKATAAAIAKGVPYSKLVTMPIFSLFVFELRAKNSILNFF